MSVHKASVRCRFSYFFLALVILLAFGAAVFLGQLSRHINEISEYEGKKTANDLINNAISQQLEKNSEQFIIINRDKNEKIISIETNSYAVNQVSNNITSAINENLKISENNEINVPIGTLSGINFFTGRGFDVGLRLHQIGAVKTDMKSEFISQGINQTKHRLYIKVTVEMSAILPAHSTDITVETDYLISETVIVGEIPEMYLSKD